MISNILPLLLGKKEEDLDVIKHQDHLEKLSGHYEAFRGSHIKVIRKGALLQIEDPEPSTFSMPPTSIHPLEDDLETMKFYIYTLGGNKAIVEFVEDNDGIWLHIERSKLKKIKDF